jgi:hypothetical protein
MSALPLSQPALWTRARASFARAVDAIGAPAAIAAITLLTHAMRRTIAGYVLRLEHVVRRVLLAEAAQIQRAQASRRELAVAAILDRRRPRRHSVCNVAPSVRIEAAGEGARGPVAFNAVQCRFSFALPRDPRAVPEAHAPRIRALWGNAPQATPRRIQRAVVAEEHASLRLARRLEALRRVLDDPIPHARRLARLLTRAVRRFPEIAHCFAVATSRTNDYDRADDRLSVDAMACAIGAADAFANSS